MLWKKTDLSLVWLRIISPFKNWFLIFHIFQQFQLYFLGSGPDRGQSPVEWEDFPSVRWYVGFFVSPPLPG